MERDRPSATGHRTTNEPLTATTVDRVGRGRVVVTSATAVVDALESSALAVVAPQLPRGRIEDVVGRMARFVEGPEHETARRAAVDALAAVDGEGARRASLDVMRAAVADALDADGAADVTALARRTTTEVLAGALGFADPGRTVGAVLTVASTTAPVERQPPPPPAAVDRAVDCLEAAAPTSDVVTTANLIGLLLQAVDATTGLVTGALCPRRGWGAVVPGCGRDRVHATLALDPPVVSTRRVAVGPTHVDGLVVAPGDDLVLRLSARAALDDPNAAEGPVAPPPTTRPLAFGAGRHACPGWEHAIEMASGMVDAVAHAIADGARLDGPVRHEPRANLRIAESLLLVVGPTPGGTR